MEGKRHKLRGRPSGAARWRNRQDSGAEMGNQTVRENGGCARERDDDKTKRATETEPGVERKKKEEKGEGNKGDGNRRSGGKTETGLRWSEGWAGREAKRSTGGSGVGWMGAATVPPPRTDIRPAQPQPGLFAEGSQLCGQGAPGPAAAAPCT